LIRLPCYLVLHHKYEINVMLCYLRVFEKEELVVCQVDSGQRRFLTIAFDPRSVCLADRDENEVASYADTKHSCSTAILNSNSRLSYARQTARSLESPHSRSHRPLGQHFSRSWQRFEICYGLCVSNSGLFFNHGWSSQQLLSSCFPPVTVNFDLDLQN